MKVLMLPHASQFHKHESGIRRVVEAYFRYLPRLDIELVEPDATSYDIKAVHAGMTGSDCDVAHLHGLYWTADYDTPRSEYESNRRIVKALRQAREVTVPSRWVAETFQRDMRFTPHVIPHGIEWQEWPLDKENQGYVLWNKNRVGDVCDPTPLHRLAEVFPKVHFVTTFALKEQSNVTNSNGIIPHEYMKLAVQQAGVYLATTKETFGLGTLEAMVSGVPILGWNVGGNLDLVEHGVNGYLAEYGDYDDLAEGLSYCLGHGRVLGANGRELARKWTWESACRKVASVYQGALQEQEPTVSIVIPCYNKEDTVQRAIKSALDQEYVTEIVVVNDGSTDQSLARIQEVAQTDRRIKVIDQSNQGVANARNSGIAQSDSKYCCCLDSDDEVLTGFVEVCVSALERDRSLGIAYTALQYTKPGGETGTSLWPNDWDFNRQLQKSNQVPTCCVFRREMWERLGGYRQRYAPKGAGAEDAEFWLRAGAYGYKAEKVTEEALFHYSWMSGQVTGDPNYQEVDWLSWHPWVKDGLHPLASHATPKNGLSHPVRQYDNPVVSVVIPVGPGHRKQIINALDSLEAQTFRKWEAVVVWDFNPHEDEEVRGVEKAYPYVRFLTEAGVMWPKGRSVSGSGAARNSGVRCARAPFILFLDADDTLHPDAIQRMLEYWNEHKAGIYPDYVGEAFIDGGLARKLEKEQRLLSYNPDDGEALIAYESGEFDCHRALNQPESLDNPYIWNLITTLIPKSWHDGIGGFDEDMETWEDWDYWLRMAKAGYCFQRLPEQLVRYRFYTGSRRDLAAADTEHGRQLAQKMIEYIKNKHSRLEVRDVGCGCGKSKVNGREKGGSVTATSVQQSGMSDSDFVRAKYTGRRGNHHIVGAFQFNHDPGLPSRKVAGNKWVLYYGYKSNGYETLVHREDVRLMVGKWQMLSEIQMPQVEKKVVPEPVSILEMSDGSTTVDLSSKPDFLQAILNEKNVTDFDLQSLPGITPAIASRMNQQGIDTPEEILRVGVEGLKKIKGIAESRARTILRALENK